MRSIFTFYTKVLLIRLAVTLSCLFLLVLTSQAEVNETEPVDARSPVTEAKPTKPSDGSVSGPTTAQSTDPTNSPTNSQSGGVSTASTANLTSGLSKNCERHFSGAIQSEVRSACTSAGQDYVKFGRSLAEIRCRLNYGEEPRLVMACLIGASVADDMKNGREEFKHKLQLCSETYPMHNEIDSFLQESCLTGAHIPDFIKTEGKSRLTVCTQVTPERSFIGPCIVGLELAQEKDDAALAPANQNHLCDQYFNSKRFHKGYRACLNARGLATDPSRKVSDALHDCSDISSEANNETEKAACLVGLTIHRHLLKKEDVAKRFQKCGENKVTYQDRDFLACLTAASLLDFTDKGGAETGCRELFKDAKSHGRGDCLNALNLF